MCRVPSGTPFILVYRYAVKIYARFTVFTARNAGIPYTLVNRYTVKICDSFPVFTEKQQAIPYTGGKKTPGNRYTRAKKSL